METNIKIVRLQSGEDIIANYFCDDENQTIMLDNPLHIIFKRLNRGQTVMMMMPWLPVEIIKDNHAIITASNVLTILEPNDNLLQHYGNSILEIQEGLDAKGDENPFEDFEVESEEEIDDMRMEEIMKLMHNKKKSNIH